METHGELTPLFGREEILGRLEQRLEALKKGYRQNVGLVGHRFIGKTTLLRHLLKKSRQDRDLISLYVSVEGTDFDSFSERWLGALLQGFLLTQGIPFPEEFQTLVKISRSYIPKTLDAMREAKKEAFRKRTSNAFRQLLSLTGTLGRETGKKILLVLDEFQALGDLEVTDPFGLFGKEMMVQKDTFYLVTSSEPERCQEIFHHRLALLFGNFEIISLGPLSSGSVGQLVAHRLPGFPVPDADQRILSHLFDNDPCYFDLFCETASRIVQAEKPVGWSRSLMLEMVEQSLFSNQGALNRHFECELRNLLRFGRLLRPYLKALLAIANGRVKLLPIAAYMGRRVPETQKILQRLADEGMVEKKGLFYCLPNLLFRFWLRNVFQAKDRNLEPDEGPARVYFRSRLQEEIHRIEETERQDLTERISSLFREFRNEVVEIEERKMRCPAFLEIASRPTNGRYFPILGRTSQGRWFCQVARELLTEGDVAVFSEELKRFRRKPEQRILVALGGMELNARLMAQEAKIQIWDLDHFNALLDLYGQLKVIA